MVEVTFNFNELRCIHQYDGGGPSEPYMWIVFFYVDASTLTSQGDFVATMNMRTDISGRQLFQEGVRPGRTIPIPETLGRARILLDDTGLAPPAIGAVYALLEENGTTDTLMKMGHQEFGQAFHEEINDYVRGHLPSPPPISAEERQAMSQRIEERVFDRVHDAADFLEYFRSADRVIGFATEYFPWPALTWLRDQAPGQPHQIPQTIRKERTVVEYPNRLVTAVDEYEVRGSIQVSPYTPPPSDPCQTQKDAYNQAARLVEQLRDAITRLREKFAQAPPSEKPDIAAEIAETQASLDRALDAARQARNAYNQCRNQNSNLRKQFTF